MYAYPQHISARLIETMASSPQVCHYLDLPLQHAHPATLKRMRRSPDTGAVRELIMRLRLAIPDITLRTTFIVGFPGETEEEFSTLLDFMSSVAFDRVGVFVYSPEEGTAAANLPNPVARLVAAERYGRAMELQRSISLARNQLQVGRTVQVLLEGSGEGLTLGRTYRDAPEIDGYVLLAGELRTGQMVSVRIDQALEYDLRGSILDKQVPGL
jgi:ribosomal protein S12 methylthiotransferase